MPEAKTISLPGRMRVLERINPYEFRVKVSKWETGKAMPDSDIMLKLCDILEISVNELLCGEKIDTVQKIDQLNELIFQTDSENAITIFRRNSVPE